MNSPGLMTGGIVLTATGITAIPIGSLVVVIGESTHTVCAGGDGFVGGCNTSPAASATVADKKAVPYEGSGNVAVLDPGTWSLPRGVEPVSCAAPPGRLGSSGDVLQNFCR